MTVCVLGKIEVKFECNIGRGELEGWEEDKEKEYYLELSV